MLHKPLGPYEKYIKRIFDLFCSVCALFFFWWLYLIIAVLVRIKLGSPVIFKQERPGKNEKVFKLFKFRSMTNETDENGILLPDELRLTKFGMFLRSSSLDELPEVFNIIKGDMSVIGPRPLLISYLPWYSDSEKHRHDVRPGLSGLAQVNGRNFLDWDKRLALDVEYVSNITFIGDMKIIIKSISHFFKKDDIAVVTDDVEGNLAEIRSKEKQEVLN